MPTKKEAHQPTLLFILVCSRPVLRWDRDLKVGFVISEHAACKRLMENKTWLSDWNYNKTEGRFMVLLIAWLSLVIYSAIIQSCTELEIKGGWVVGRVGV